MRLSIMSILFCVSLASAEPPQAPPLTAPPQAPPVSVPPQAPPPSKALAEANAVYEEAVRNGTFVVWFDQKPVIEGRLLEWRGSTGVITISGPWHNNRHITYATFSSATFQQVKAALAQAHEAWNAERQVGPLAARPFREPAAPVVARSSRWPLQSAGEVVDGDLTRRGPWPSDLEFPAGMSRYARAAHSQSIAVTDGRHTINPVHRLNLDPKWHQSGGMLGIRNFRSDLYRWFPESPDTSTDWIQVFNGSNFQNNLGYKVQYPNGSKFLDVLSKDGDVFEIRQRVKESGKWQSSVIFEDAKARPFGYSGLTVSCNSCHREAGQGGYAVGLAPGGDGVLSVGFRPLEK